MHGRIVAKRWAAITACIGLVFAPDNAAALVTKSIPLSERLANTPHIILAKVEKIYEDKPALVLALDAHLKGKLAITRFPINLKGDAEGKKLNHSAKLRKRLTEKMVVILFIDVRIVDGTPARYTVFGFTNGTWFQVIGRPVEENRIVWAFTHCEPYLRRTFAGTTEELRKIIVDGLAGRKKPPEPNQKEKPGLGPEVPSSQKKEAGSEKEGRRGPSSQQSSLTVLGPPFAVLSCPPVASMFLRFAVIPTLGIGGPLAILAMLFPGLFGGALLVLRNWTALLTVAGINSTLVFVSLWFPRLLRGTWLATGLGLWYAMLLITLVGTMWAWRAHYRQMWARPADSLRATRSEHVILWLASIAFLATFLLIYLTGHLAASDPSWKLVVVFTIGFWAAALYLLAHRLRYSRQTSPRPPMPAHVVILWGMVFASTAIAAAWPAPAYSLASALQADKDGVVQVAWQRVLPSGGFVVSPPLAHGDRVYVAAAHKQGGADTFGALYCLSAASGKQLWKFDNDGEMFQVFSAPTIVDGRLFIGEGFHENKGCRLYCLDAKSGEKLWDFPTESHTESSPCVANGKVYIGAGDDGVYCVDVKNGKKVWQYPADSDTVPTVFPTKSEGQRSKQPLKLHVDASPVIVGNRLFAGSGVNRDAPGCAPAVFCLDALTGKKVWLMPLLDDNLPVWGSPVAGAGKVYFGLGNGDIINDATEPKGALLCVDAKTGREEWRFEIDNSVLRKPALDSRRVFFGSRNGACYAVERATGKLRWKTEIGSPVIASPTLFECAHCATRRLYVLGSGGKAVSLNPETGLQLWEMDFGASTLLTSTPCVASVSTSRGESRHIYFGAGLGNSEQAALICLQEK